MAFNRLIAFNTLICRPRAVDDQWEKTQVDLLLRRRGDRSGSRAKLTRAASEASWLLGDSLADGNSTKEVQMNGLATRTIAEK